MFHSDDLSVSSSRSGVGAVNVTPRLSNSLRPVLIFFLAQLFFPFLFVLLAAHVAVALGFMSQSGWRRARVL